MEGRLTKMPMSILTVSRSNSVVVASADPARSYDAESTPRRAAEPPNETDSSHRTVERGTHSSNPLNQAKKEKSQPRAIHQIERREGVDRVKR